MIFIDMSINQSLEKTLDTLLLDTGLSEKESKVYQILLEKGTLKAGEIIKLSGLKKGIAYNILYKLAKEGLITQFDKEKKLTFQVTDPEKLHAYVDRKKQAINDVAHRIEKMLPQMKSQYKLAVGKPTIQYYEGVEGIKAVFEDIYAKKEQENIVWGCGDVDSIDMTLPNIALKHLIPKRIRNKLLAVSFFADGPMARQQHEKDAQHLRKSVLIPPEKYPLPAEIDVYDDKIALLSFKKGEFIGMIIQNQEFATTLKSVFRLGFNQFPDTAEKINHKTRRKA